MTVITPDALTPGQRVAELRAAEIPAAIRFDRGRVTHTAAGMSAEASCPPADAGASVPSVDAGASVDVTGWMVSAPLADLHAHLDKAYTWHAAGEPEGSLDDAVAAWDTFSATHAEERIFTGAGRQLRAALRSGVTAVRTHANFHNGSDPLRGVRALVRLRDEFEGLVDVQIVAMPSHVHPDGMVRDAIALGADLLGGAPHLSPDPHAELTRIVALAEQAGIGVDVHTDENLDPRSLGLLDLAHMTTDWPSGMIRSAGHCVSLAMQTPESLTEVLDAVSAAGVGIVTNPLTNLFLQGRSHPVATPRAIPPLRAILSAGIELAAGGDNVQDPFNPLGNADMVDVVASLVLAGHLTPRTAWEIGSTGGRAVFGLPPAGGREGDVADVLLVRGDSTAGIVAERAPDRVVIRAGRVIATRRVHTDSLGPVDHARDGRT